jgi:hypothetical protein
MTGRIAEKSNSSKLSRLQTELGPGLLATASWLGARGYYRQLLDHYVSAGWLESPARGVYRRPGPALKWQQVVSSLQNVLALPVHVGGLTALDIEGYVHFLPLSESGAVHLYSQASLPSWLGKLPLRDRLFIHKERLFYEATSALEQKTGVAREAVSRSQAFSIGLKQLTWGEYDAPLVYSTPERAILEFLYEVPKRESISHANLLMRGLRTLSPRRLTELLQKCRSIKVKRLFLALAERTGQPWLEELEVDAFDLGKGKRVLVPGGKLHPKYLITLPENLDDSA